jgi:prepilin-type N-terminal cleavage/methylation domain-containing protein
MRGTRARVCQAGYSIIELLVVVGIASVLSAMAMFEIGNARPAYKGDGAMRVIMAQMNTAREMAITQRRYMEVVFASGNQVQIVRHDAGAATTVLSTIPLEGGVKFALLAAVPDTPDAFGNHSAVDFGSATKFMFGTDGRLIDQGGGLINGTIYLAVPNEPRSQRAVTILGNTGRVRGYKWNGAAWTLV